MDVSNEYQKIIAYCSVIILSDILASRKSFFYETALYFSVKQNDVRMPLTGTAFLSTAQRTDMVMPSLYQMLFFSLTDSSCPVGDAQFLICIFAVILYRTFFDAQFFTYLNIGKTFCLQF